jgi:voltage-gated potassium channel
VIRDEVGRLVRWEERHQRLVARLAIALAVTLMVDVVCALLVWRLERHADGTEIHGFGDALFFSTVQLLTVSSQLKNPVTTAGRFVDVALEVWALVVVTWIAGSFAAFFGGADTGGPTS